MSSSPADTQDVVAPFSIDLATGDVHWSPPIYHLHGLGPEAQRPSLEALLAAIIPEDRDRVREELSNGLRDGGSFCTRYRLRGPDGLQHEIQLAAVGSRLNGVTTYVTGFLLDVTAVMTARVDAAVTASAASRAAIEQAKGAVMLGYTVTEQEAFTVLRRYSNERNVKLSVLAERIVQALDAGAHGEFTAQHALIAALAELAEAVKSDRGAKGPASSASRQGVSPVPREQSAPRTPA
jgi:hypothetical protein